MLAAPAAGLSLPDKIDATRVLLQSGLPIADVNAVRKHLSAIKGGQLAAAAGQSISFAISDVHAPVEDDPAVIGSGPTVGDDSTFASALGALERAGILDAMPAAVVERLGAGLRGDYPETVRPGDPRLRRSSLRRCRITSRCDGRGCRARKGARLPRRHRGSADTRGSPRRRHAVLRGRGCDEPACTATVVHRRLGGDHGPCDRERPGRAEPGIRSRRGARASCTRDLGAGERRD